MLHINIVVVFQENEKDNYDGNVNILFQNDFC